MKERFKWIAALAAFATWSLSAQAQQRIEIFDAHLHYNQEPKPFYSLDQVRDVVRRNGITGIIATSRPNKGTHELVDALLPEERVEGPPVEVGHLEVRQDHVIGLLLEPGQGVTAIARRADAVAIAAQESCQGADDARLIVND